MLMPYSQINIYSLVTEVVHVTSTRAMKEMKRSLETSTTPACTWDVVEVIHCNIALYVLCLPEDLLNWHTTCRRHYRGWCHSLYLKALLKTAVNAADALYSRTCHSRYFLALMHLEVMVHTVVLCDRLLILYRPSRCQAFSNHASPTDYFLRESCTAEKVLNETLKRLTDDWVEKIPRKAEWLFRMAAKRLIRFGWRLCFYDTIGHCYRENMSLVRKTDTVFLKISM